LPAVEGLLVGSGSRLIHSPLVVARLANQSNQRREGEKTKRDELISDRLLWCVRAVQAPVGGILRFRTSPLLLAFFDVRLFIIFSKKIIVEFDSV
jgi:hypothetical protein